jgi:hypothetical protein
MLFREIVVYSEDHKKSINTLGGQNVGLLIVKAGGTYIQLLLGFRGLNLNSPESTTDILNVSLS